jgi:site-specific recombinase XerC
MMKKDKKDMKKDLRNIVDKLVWSADSVCFNNSKDHLCFDLCSDDSRADVVSFNLQQDDFQHVKDKSSRAILQQHGLKVSDIKALDAKGITVNSDCDDHPGCVLDDRCLFVTLDLKAAKFLSSVNHLHW